MTSARRFNDFAGCAIGAVAGISMCTHRVIHRLHHKRLYSAEDPDIALVGGYPRGRAYLLRKLATDLSGITAWKTYACFFGNPAANAVTAKAQRPLDDTAPSLKAAARADRRSVLATRALLVERGAMQGAEERRFSATWSRVYTDPA